MPCQDADICGVIWLIQAVEHLEGAFARDAILPDEVIMAFL
jgi:hypothetical protein